jgi:hypothetical protein
MVSFNTGDIAPGTHWKREQLGLRAGLDVMEKMHYRESKPGIQAVARYYTD